MLFNSYLFIFAFLPIAYIFFTALRRIDGVYAYHLVFLTVASFVFYAAWDTKFLPILIGSILVNFVFMRLILSFKSPAFATAIMASGVFFNLALLGYFKYSSFFTEALFGKDSLGTDWVYSASIPIGISFFTFQQIMYLVDARNGAVKDHSLLHHTLFITFFPQVIAGPIVQHNELIPQFSKLHLRDRAYDLGIGLSIFSIGLFKKTVIGDNMAIWADMAFAAAGNGGVDCIDAWLGALAYALQIYFDFSAYSDMAVGLAWMFGIELPINFFSPYKSTSIIEFWRRWHITLSRFLRNYLYIPIGGNRGGLARQVINLMVVMLLGGLWHGAGWTFLIWGALHGVALIVNHVWRMLTERLGLPAQSAGLTRQALGWLITFLFVIAAWVPFRSPNLDTTYIMYSAMFMTDPAQISIEWTNAMNAAQINFARWCRLAGTIFPQIFPGNGMGWDHLAGELNNLLSPVTFYPVLLFLCLLITVGLPNVGQIFADHWKVHPIQSRTWISWHPSLAWAAVSAFLFVASIMQLSGFSPFIYFQFLSTLLKERKIFIYERK